MSDFDVNSNGNAYFNDNKLTTTTSNNCTTTDYWYWIPSGSYGARPRCKYCDGFACKTIEQCPRIKKITYFRDGTVSKVEFHKLG